MPCCGAAPREGSTGGSPRAAGSCGELMVVWAEAGIASRRGNARPLAKISLANDRPTSVRSNQSRRRRGKRRTFAARFPLPARPCQQQAKDRQRDANRHSMDAAHRYAATSRRPEPSFSKVPSASSSNPFPWLHPKIAGTSLGPTVQPKPLLHSGYDSYGAGEGHITSRRSAWRNCLTSQVNSPMAKSNQIVASTGCPLRSSSHKGSTVAAVHPKAQAQPCQHFGARRPPSAHRNQLLSQKIMGSSLRSARRSFSWYEEPPTRLPAPAY